MLRRAIQPVHAQMLLSHACLLHLSQPFQPLLAVAASTTRSQPCSAACAITVSRRKATFVTHAGTLTPSSPSYIRGASAHGRPSRPQACCTEWQLHSRPGGHDRVRSRSRSRSRGDSRASPPRGDGAPPTEPSHELVQAAAAVVMAATGTGSNRRRGNSAGTGKGNGHGKGKGKNKDKGSRR